MRILCVDTEGGCCLGWLMKCQDAGHQVRWYIADPKKRHVGDGLVRKVPDWREHVDWADLVFCPDNTKFLRELDGWRKRDPRKMILAPTMEGASWEGDRLKGMGILRKAGIDIPPSREFSDYDAAIAYVKKEDRPFVSKPCGPAGEQDKALSYVAKSPADLVHMLERWKKTGKLKGKFLLQEKIKGIEVAVGGWFGPSGFAEGWEENWEHKKLMAGDTGPNTGEMGTVIRQVRESKLADALLKPCEDMLRKVDYTGCTDVNCIVDEDGKAWPLEWTQRPGWPAFNITLSLMDGDPAEWLARLWEGDKKAIEWRYNKIAVGVVMAIPDFPYSNLTQKEVVGSPLYGLDDVDMSDVQLCEVMRGEAPHDVDGRVVHGPALVSAGDYILIATGVADTVHDARTRVYNTLGKISMPGSPFYRDDIGERLQRELPKLQAHGYADDMSY